MLDTNTQFIGKVLHSFDELPSTNLLAMELLSKSRPTEGTVISTYNQTAGRGQIGRTWESEPGKNLTVSIIFYPNFLPAIQNFQLNKAFALGVRDAVASCIPEASVSVKWPNDIYVNHRKISGILIQNILQSSQIQSTALGIGLNVNQAQFDSAPNASSLLLETGDSFDLDYAFQQLCYHLEYRYMQLKAGQYDVLHADYLTHLYRRGEPTPFQRKDHSVFQGTITGIDPSGRLTIVSDAGEEHFDIKEIQFILPADSN